MSSSRQGVALVRGGGASRASAWRIALLVAVLLAGAAVANAETQVYVSDYGTGSILRCDADGGNLTTLVSGISSVRGIAVDRPGGKIYWGDAGSPSIHRANLDGSGQELLVSTGSSVPYGVALDRVAGKVYWTTYSGPIGIFRANLDGSGVESVLSAGILEPLGIELDVAAGKMYWSDILLGALLRANLDGSSVETLATGLPGVNYLTLDVPGDAIYFAYSGGVARTHLDGSGLAMVIAAPGSGVALDSSGRLFRTLEDGFSVRRVALDGSGDTAILAGLSRPLGIAVVSGETIPPLQQKLLPTYTPADPATGANFGHWSLDLEGDTLVTGAWHDDSPVGSGTGAAYVFRRAANGAWNLEAKLAGSDIFPGSAFGGSVALSGDTVLVGAVYANAAYVFERNAGGANHWGQVARLSAGGCYFGSIVGLSGDTAAVANDCGNRADLFERNAGGPEVWGHVSTLNAGGGFGRSLALDGDTLFVSAIESGIVSVRERNAGGPEAWGEVRQLTAAGSPAPAFGYRMAIAGDLAIVTSFDGVASVYERNAGGTGNWGATGTLLPADHQTGDDFGVSVAIDGTTAVLGSWHDDVGANVDQGSATVFARDQGGAGAWGAVGKLLAGDGEAGDGAWGVGLSGGTFALGAPYDDNEAGSDAGAVYLFSTMAITPVSPAVRLLDSHGSGLAGATVSYYQAGWQTLGTTGADGRLLLSLAPASYPFRVEYGGATQQKSQNIATAPEVVFQTRDVTVQLLDSAGQMLDPGVAEYYAAGWKPFGTTAAGVAHRELLPTSYTFAMSYGGARIQKAQDVSSAPVVTFQTRDVAVQLVDSLGQPLDPGVAEYYAAGWKPFGTTAAGVAHRELLPTSYTFAMSYGGARIQKAQDVSSAPVVTFQTRDVAVQLADSQGQPLDPGVAEYYAAGWKPFGTTAAGVAHRELLPTSYTFAMSYGGARIQKAQDVSSAPVVSFQTRDVVVLLQDHLGQPLDTGVAEYYAAGWKPFGSTAGGAVHRELLPTSYTFAMIYAGGRVQRVQDVSASSTVVFQTGSVISDSGTCTSYYAGGWRPFAQGIELLPTSYTFRFSSGTPSQAASSVTAGVENHIR